jgi:enamine deaminase RidA (YjgF/YER057c/UK114 family)
MFRRVADAVREAGAHAVSQEVFGLSDSGGAGMAILKGAFGNVEWPVTWIENEASDSPVGTLVWAVAGVRVEPLRLGDRVLGSLFEDGHARYCRLGGVVPADKSRTHFDQTRNVLDQMESALRTVGMGFPNVVRTWFCNDRILDWYGEFNDARNAFFTERRIYDGVVPASTGVGGRNSTGGALACGLLAVKPKINSVYAVAVPSPLQCPAVQYGSSFSRAVEVKTPEHRRLLISGTASIDPDGRTVHVGDVEAQVALTMEVVKAILESRRMGWPDVSRAIGYFKSPGDVRALERYCARAMVDSLPVVLVHEDICRDDLLFEIELDALTSR